MRIAFTHNLQKSAAEDEAEFDPPEAVEAVCASIERVGHRVEPIDVSHELGSAIEHLLAFRADLVFNAAEGRRGPLREALFPALFEELRLPYTGSSASTMALTLDKRLAKLIAESAGIPTPRSQFLRSPADLEPEALEPPLIVKPNFEGSSKGIRSSSLVEDSGDLAPTVGELLSAYPEGVLVEELLGSRDVTVPFLEAAAPARGGVLEPVGYVFHRQSEGPEIYDYELKNKYSDLVELITPLPLAEPTIATLRELALTAVQVFAVRDLGRADFRVSDEGAVSFLELNPLPYLHPETSIYAAAALEGVDADGVIGSIIFSAARRWGLSAD